MQKIAQRRGILNKLREMTDFEGKSLERDKKLNPQFKETMDNLRKTDNNIRSIVAGESIGEEKNDETKEKFKGDPGKHPISMKQILKQVKSNLNRREYMKATADLRIFASKVNEINFQISSFVNSIDDFHHQFLFGTEDEPALTEEQFKGLKNIKDLWKDAQHQDQLVKEAGLSDIADFIHNTFRDRGRALSAYEKRYAKKVEKLKKDSNKLLSESEGLLSQTLAFLKEMASFRAVRNPDSYVALANKLVEKNKGYISKFKVFWTDNDVDRFVEKANIYPTKEVKDTGVGNQEVDTAGTPPAGASPAAPADVNIPSPPPGRGPTAFEGAPTALPPPSKPGVVITRPETMAYHGTPGEAVVAPPAMAPPHAPPARTTKMYGDGLTPAPGSAPGATDPSQLAPPNEFNASESVAQQILSQNPDIAKRLSEPSTGAHGKFYDTLEKMSHKNPAILAAFISKYAKSIQGTDPETAVKLFKVAHSVKG